jgi:hypothetical protein
MFAARIMEALGEQIDTHRERLTVGVVKRFPGVPDDDPEALALIGQERRIRRGPGEPAATYAPRLRAWWDDHRTRGGPYALLRQLFLFWRHTINPQIDVVYHSGTRRSVDADGVITRDAITWSADGTSLWSQIWIFFHLVDGLPGNILVDEFGNELVDEEGNVLVDEGGSLSPAQEEEFRVIPREWSAAHILRTTIVLLWGEGRLWDYPQPIPTWDDRENAGHTWDGELPIVLVVEG